MSVTDNVADEYRKFQIAYRDGVPDGLVLVDTHVFAEIAARHNITVEWGGPQTVKGFGKRKVYYPLLFVHGEDVDKWQK